MRHTLPKMRIVIWAAIVLLLIWNVYQWVNADDLIRHGGIDYLGYWASARVFLQAGNPYDPAAIYPIERNLGLADSKALIMWGPPWIHTFMLPFVVLPFRVGRVAWFAVNLMILLQAAGFLWRLQKGRRALWIPGFAVLAFIPSALSLNIGGISPLLLAGLVGFIWAAQKKSDWAAAFFLLLLSFKPHVVYLFWFFVILWILKARRWKILLGAVMLLAGGVLLTWLINPGIYSNYLRALFSDYGVIAWETPTLSTVLRILYPNRQEWLLYLPATIALPLSYWLWRRWRSDFCWQRALIPIALLSILSAPYSWASDLVVLVPVVLQVLMRFEMQPARQWPWLASLITMQVAIAFQLYTAGSYFVLWWVAPSIALIHILSSRAGPSLEQAHLLRARSTG